MKPILFLILITITPVLLNEIKPSPPLPYLIESNQSVHEANEKVKDSIEGRHDNCPNNKVLVQTLQVLKGSLVQDGENLNPEKFRHVLDGLIDYVSKSQTDSNADHKEDSKNYLKNANNRSKKEALRIPQLDDLDSNEKLSGKITLQYELPPVSSPDCQTLFSAIVNLIQSAYSQISTFCSKTGKCHLSKENHNEKIETEWVPPYEIPYKTHENALHPIVLANSTKLVDVVSQYPQNIDLLTILQNYRPKSDVSIKVNKVPDSKQEFVLNNALDGNGIARQKDSLLEILSVLNRPSGYAKINVDSAPSISSSKLTLGNLTPLQIVSSAESAVSKPLKLREPVNIEQLNMTSIPANMPEDDNNLRLNEQHLQVNEPGRNPYTIQSTISKNLGYKLMPNSQNYRLNYLQVPQPNAFPNGAKLSANQGFSQLSSNKNPYYSASATYYQQPKPPSGYFTQQKQNLPNQQVYYNYQSQSPYLSPGSQNSQQNLLFDNKQGPYYNSIYAGSQRILGYPQTDQRLADFLKNLNNTGELHNLYRLSVSNGQKLNIAPNKNGLIELTFTLQRPQTMEYKPLYYVKYRLPYQTYMYNLQNLQAKPFLRSNAMKLYEQLLAVANITESSQDLKDLDKEEISKLVAANGALVKAKMLDDSNNSVDDIVGEEVKNILKLSSRLGPEGMLNATKNAIHNIEDATSTNKTGQPPIVVHKLIKLNETSDSPNVSENPKSQESPVVNIPYFQSPLNGIPYVRPNISYNKARVGNSMSNVYPSVNY